MMTTTPAIRALTDAVVVASAQVGPEAGAPLMDLPLGEVLLGAATMAGLFVLFGLRAPAERSGGCGSCAGDCVSCSVDGEDCV
jgi:hypothetical protein